MKDNNYKKTGMPIFLMAFSLVLLGGCFYPQSKPDNRHSASRAKSNVEHKEAEEITEYAVEAPPFSDGIFPCNNCHSDLEPNPKRRELTDMHEDISAIFDHDKENRWCLDCHDLQNRDSLKLASGKLLDFKESYKLCGQCHGEKLRDWKVGVHGQRTGKWNGRKEYLLCVHCHNPHSPKFKELTPEPPPVRQENIK